MENKDLFKKAANDITQLRQINNVLAAKVQMFDDMMLLFKARPPEMGMARGEDIVYDLQKAAHEIEMAETRATSPPVKPAENPVMQRIKDLKTD